MTCNRRQIVAVLPQELAVYVLSYTYAQDYTERGFTHLYSKLCSLVRC